MKTAMQVLVVLVGTAAAAWWAAPHVQRAWTTVSTDDAYVNGHVTFVAPRVAGQVTRVLVEDNARVRRGEPLVELDPEPYRVQVELKAAALERARAGHAVALAQARSLGAKLAGQRWQLAHTMESVDAQIAQLHTKIAQVAAQRANAARLTADGDRARKLMASGSISREELDHREKAAQSADAGTSAALAEVRQIRASLGLAPEGMGEVPGDLRRTHSSVRQARADLMQTAAQLGLSDADAEPVLAEVPSVRDAAAAVATAARDLEAARLNLSYTRVVAETDGVITRRNVNTGNTVQVGQGLMAIRSLSEIWIDANFKETQLADLRIGQRVEIYVDMYGEARPFRGRITGFTMGTGSTLSLLPAQNATGNFVKVVQRLPVRIELTEPNPEESPLFIGLSVTPYVLVKEPPVGPDAGRFLQPGHAPAMTLATVEVRP